MKKTKDTKAVKKLKEDVKKQSEEIKALTEKKGEAAKVDVEPKKQTEGGDESIQTAYYPASESCHTLDTVVPNSMAVEQKKFNQFFRTAIEAMGTTVDDWVAKKLHYKDGADLCVNADVIDASTGKPKIRFAQEQIDAIGTAIWNHENSGDAIIIADQTGVGKGRSAAGLLRYAILEKKVIPFFFTASETLLNDIYRDFIDIGFDAGVPYKIKTVSKEQKTEFTDEEILNIIKEDIKEHDEVRVDYFIDSDEESPNYFNLNWIRKSVDESHKDFERIEAVRDDLIQLYRQYFIEHGFESEQFEINPNYDAEVQAALRKGKYLLYPFVSSRIDIKDVDGNILYPALTGEEIRTIYRFKRVGKKLVEDPTQKASDMVLPAKFKLFCTPYSQVGTAYMNYQGKKVLRSRIKLFQKYSHGSVMILDESHKASGMNEATGATSKTAELIYQFVKNASMTTYLSATYAKRASSMPLYALKTSIRESGIPDQEMIRAFLAGGNALQEAVSAELTRNGQLLRREKIIQGKSSYYYENNDTEIGQNQIAKLDRIAAIYTKVIEFSDHVRGAIKEYKEGLTQDEKEKIKPARGVNAMAFQLFNFMLLGLKVRQTTEFAVKNLKAGKKTIITVASTLESALDNLSKTFLHNNDKDSYKIGDTIKNDFILYMAYLLNYTMRYYEVDVKVDDDGEEQEVKKLVYILDSDDDLSEYVKERMLDTYKAVLEEIMETDTGIPIAPLDQIKEVIKAAGFKVDEITGRGRTINFSKGDFSKGVITKREIRRTDEVVRDFNENEVDCLLINQSGATGISMHASVNKKASIYYEPSLDKDGNVLTDEDGLPIDNAPKSLENKKEVKKRAMIITQMDFDINVEVQKLGRINRTGQKYQPEYTYIVSAIPSESRLTSLMEKKLRSLSANVSSNQQQSAYLFTADDFFSEMAVEPFNETLNAIGMRGNNRAVNGGDIQNFTKTLYFREYNLQKDFYDTFSKLLTKEIQTLTSQGLYKGKMTTKDYFAETKATFPFFIGDNNAKTSFGRHSFIEKATVTLFKSKNIEKNIETAISDRMHLKSGSGGADKDVFYSRLPLFKEKASDRLDMFFKEREKSAKEHIKECNENLARIEKETKDKKKELSGLGKINEALALQEQLTETTKKYNELTKQMTDLLNASDIEGAQRLMLETAPLGNTKKELETKLVAYADVLKDQYAHRDISRQLGQLEKDAEKWTERSKRHYKNIEEMRRLVARCKDYVGKIGTMQQLTVNEEDISYENEAGEYQVTIQKITYTPKHTEPVIITGVSFPGDEADLTPGKFDVYMSGVTEKYSYNIYQLHKEFDEEEIKLGYKPTVTLKFIDDDYKGKWNEIAGQVDNAYKEDRFIVIGSLLRTFTLANNSSITGQIIKYNTDKGKMRIGIEIADNKNPADGRKSVYRVLQERYDTETSLNFPVYYDANKENVHRFITEYIYKFMFGNVYQHIKDNVRIKDSTIPLEISDYLEFAFQISIADKELFIVVAPEESLCIEANKTIRSYKDGKAIKSKIEIEEFTNRLGVKIISDSVSVTDYFATHLSQYCDVEINSENYSIGTKSKQFPEITPSKYDGRGRQRFARRNDYGEGLFKTTFPTNLMTIENTMNYGFEYTGKLEISFRDFIKVLDVFAERKRKPTFATSSSYFEQFKSDYVFEQFADEQIQTISVDTNKDVKFDTSAESADEKEVSEMIDELVLIMTTK